MLQYFLNETWRGMLQDILLYLNIFTTLPVTYLRAHKSQINKLDT